MQLTLVLGLQRLYSNQLGYTFGRLPRIESVSIMAHANELLAQWQVFPLIL